MNCVGGEGWGAAIENNAVAPVSLVWFSKVKSAGAFSHVYQAKSR